MKVNYCQFLVCMLLSCSLDSVDQEQQQRQQPGATQAVNLQPPPAANERNIFVFAQQADFAVWENWHLLGTFTINSSVRALLLDPSGDTHVIQEHSSLGDWLVDTISRNEITFSHGSGVRFSLANNQ